MKRKNSRSVSDPENLVAGFQKALPADKPEKQPRTLLLVDRNFEDFQQICEKEGVKPAHVIDNWIADFLKAYK